MDLKFSAHTYFMMRNSNLNSVSTENQHEILNKFGKCLFVNIFVITTVSIGTQFHLSSVVCRRLSVANNFFDMPFNLRCFR